MSVQIVGRYWTFAGEANAQWFQDMKICVEINENEMRAFPEAKVEGVEVRMPVGPGPTIYQFFADLRKLIEDQIEEGEHFLQNGTDGNAVVWWAKGGAGYTTDIDRAERFTKAKAYAQMRMRDGEDKPWPVWVALQGCVRCVSIARLPRHPQTTAHP